MSQVDYVDYIDQARERSATILKNSPIYCAFLSVFTRYLNKEQSNLIWLSKNLLNIDVAEGYHLDLIGQVVGQPRVLASFDTGVYFGFKGAYQSDTFGDLENEFLGGYWLDGSKFNTETATTLNDELYRRVIHARIIKNNIWNGSHDEVIEIVNLLTNRTDNVVYTNKHSQMTFQIEKDEDGLLSYFLSRLECEDNILPIPFGVSVELI